MVSNERLLVTQELHAMLLDYWHDVDTNWGRNAGDYYTDDGVFEMTRTTYHGRPKIEEFYRWRIAQGPRIALHAVHNFRALPESPTHATTTWYLFLYAAPGEPVLPTNPPIQIAFVTDTCLKGDDGRWRYKHRKFVTWFEGGIPPTAPKL